MQFEIKHTEQKLLIGKCELISFRENRTVEIWKWFMPRRKEIREQKGNVLYSCAVYPENFFEVFNPELNFEKWACVETGSCNEIPEGLYAVFIYRGKPLAANPFYEKIFTQILPVHNLKPDTRPHFEIIGEKYKGESDDNEEEVWIPIRKS